MTKNIKSTSKTNVMNVAEMVANSREVIDALGKKDPDKIIGPYIENQLKSLDEIEYIIVVDNEGMRYSHPNVNMIGQKFVGGDESRVVKEGDVYISEAIGTLGRSLRAFVPIYNVEKIKR
ncbi:hypothetical protein [Paraclostridium sp. AKS81]|uniref:hypothetical protein n=1 Tax=Paraclostridium sp. AKS81 TaxID=2876117 RepID=UPI0021DF6F1C|nr:hypothetical protein [Paraclostridium sp. AKS81]MCU9813366.1 hypothetical protein [Paraclostridium sp. AKS81]